MPCLSSSESILRHLPDLSDTSLQIPTTEGLDDLLLTNDDDQDFLNGIDDSLCTPTQMPPRVENETHLTLSQLTPKPTRRFGNPSVRPLPSAVFDKPIELPEIKQKGKGNEPPVATLPTQASVAQTNTNRVGKHKPKSKATVDEPSRGRFECLKDEVESLASDSNLHRSTGTEYRESRRPEGPVLPGKAESRHQRSIISNVPKEGSTAGQESTIVRSITAASHQPHAVASSAQNPRIYDDPDESTANLSSNSIVLGGAAERLVLYSQNLNTPFGFETSVPVAVRHYEPPIQPKNLIAETPERQDDVVVGVHEPLTISDVSPRKVVTQDLNVSQHGGTSPMRSSRKRRKTRIIREPRQGPNVSKGKSRNCVSGSSKGWQSTSERTDLSESETVGGKFFRLRQGVASGPLPNTQNTKLHHAPLTRPIEFNFRSDARMEARKAELENNEKARSSSRRKPHNRLLVPDFKTLHAAQETERALRKEQITPILPVPIELKTNHRARARNEFDEMVKEKEREIERALEDRKKALEAEEEKEVREIRRRAIPKAHDVPEWYRDAPKRKRKREVVG